MNKNEFKAKVNEILSEELKKVGIDDVKQENDLYDSDPGWYWNEDENGEALVITFGKCPWYDTLNGYDMNDTKEAEKALFKAALKHKKEYPEEFEEFANGHNFDPNDEEEIERYINDLFDEDSYRYIRYPKARACIEKDENGYYLECGTLESSDDGYLPWALTDYLEVEEYGWSIENRLEDAVYTAIENINAKLIEEAQK